MTTMAAGIAYRFNRFTGRALYVSEKPGEGGKDWGYTPDRARAQVLPNYWLRRFQADMRAIGDGAVLVALHVWPLGLSRDYGAADTRNAEDHKPL